MGTVADDVCVVMVPLPAQGHLNQLLQLSCLISSYGLPVHYVGSAIHNNQARVRANGLSPKKLSTIHFHDLPLPDFDCPSPDPNASVRFPAHLQPAFDASKLLRHPIAAVLRELAAKARRVVIIHDSLMALVVQDVESISNAESYAFNCLSVFSLLSFLSNGLGNQIAIEEGEVMPRENLTEGCMTESFAMFIEAHKEYQKLRGGDIHNSNRLIEGQFIDLFEKDGYVEKMKQWFIGPILPGMIISSKEQNPCLAWLDQQPQNSVLFVSFGTMTSMSDEEGAHDDLQIEPAWTDDNTTIRDFRDFLDRAYAPRIKEILSQEPKNFKPEKESKKPKLVIMARNDSRKILNQADLIKMAQEIGFRVSVLKPNRPTGLARMYKVLNSTDALVGVHGAALTHFLFLRPGSAFIQIVPIGIDWAAETYFEQPAIKMGMKYIGYYIFANESTLIDQYDEKDPVFTDTLSVNRKGWNYTQQIYLDPQNVRLNLGRFRAPLMRAYYYAVRKLNGSSNVDS
nr:zeatin O-glucosyltransferase-like [Ipomoea batatas]